MPTLLHFDEITTPETSYLTIDEYFGEMQLDQKQKRERIRLAKKLREELLALIYMLMLLYDEGYTDTTFVEKKVVKTYKQILEEEYLEWLREIDDYVATVVPLLMLQWWKIAGEENRDKKFEKRIEEDVSETTNTIFNIHDFYEAKKQGFTRKQWVTMHDERVRLTHREVHNKIVGISELFVVGNSRMAYPRDTSNGAELKEIIRCRCSVRYLK